jgi:hypothetical protein
MWQHVTKRSVYCVLCSLVNPSVQAQTPSSALCSSTFLACVPPSMWKTRFHTHIKTGQIIILWAIYLLQYLHFLISKTKMNICYTVGLKVGIIVAAISLTVNKYRSSSAEVRIMNLLRNERRCLPLEAPKNLFDRVLARRSVETVCFLAFRNNFNQKCIAKLP